MNDKLILQKNMNLKGMTLFILARTSIFTAIMVLICWTIAILMSTDLTNEIILITSIIPIIAAIWPFIEISLYLYYKDRVFEWEFDKAVEKIQYRRTSPTVKDLKSWEIKEVKAIYCKVILDIYLGPSWNYSIGLFLKSNKRVKLHFSGVKEVPRIGQKVSEFLEIPVIYQRAFSKFFIFILGSLVALLVMGIILTFFAWPGVFLVMVSIASMITLALIAHKAFNKKLATLLTSAESPFEMV